MINSYIKRLDDACKESDELMGVYQKEFHTDIEHKSDDIIILSLLAERFRFSVFRGVGSITLTHRDDDKAIAFMMAQKVGKDYVMTHHYTRKDYRQAYRWTDGTVSTIESLLREEIKKYM